MNILDQLGSVFKTKKDLPEITFVGAHDPRQGLFLGYDDGSVTLTASQGDFPTIKQGGLSEDAVNGVAIVENQHLAVSTRSEVAFYDLSHQRMSVFDGGSHGVVATNSGSFIAPLGRRGLLIVRPQSGPVQKMDITTGTEKKLYFYHMAALHDNASNEFLVFANRKQGIGFSKFEGAGRRNVHTIMAPGVDIVDVCGVIPGSLAAVAVSTAKDLLWIGDSSAAVIEPVSYKLNDLEGVIYRVMTSSKHVFVLTSKALYVWNGLVVQAMNGRFSNRGMLRAMIPVEAIDMTIAHDEYICLVLGGNAIRCLLISDLEEQFLGNPGQDDDSNLASPELEEMDMDIVVANWSAEDVEQNDEHLVGAA